MISLVKEEDLSFIVEIQNKTMPEPWNLKEWKGVLKRLPNSFFKSIHDDKIVGFIVGQIGSSKKRTYQEGHIMSMAVEPDYQKQGIGSELILIFRRFLKTKNVFDLVLEVRTNNTKSISFYKKHNFKIDRKEKNYYDNSDDAYIMKTRLS